MSFGQGSITTTLTEETNRPEDVDVIEASPLWFLEPPLPLKYAPRDVAEALEGLCTRAVLGGDAEGVKLPSWRFSISFFTGKYLQIWMRQTSTRSLPLARWLQSSVLRAG